MLSSVLYVCTQSCLTLGNPRDCSPPGSSDLISARLQTPDLAVLNSILPVILRLGVWPWPPYSLDIDVFSRWGGGAQWEQKAWVLNWRQELPQLGLVDSGAMLFITGSRRQDVPTKGGSSRQEQRACSHQLPALGNPAAAVKCRDFTQGSTPPRVQSLSF